MLSPRKHYLRQISDRWGYLAAWEPDAAIRVGDVGVMDDWVFRPQTRAEDIDLAISAEDAASRASRQYQTAGSVSVSAQADVGAATAGAATIHVEMSRAGAVLLHALGTYETRVRDTAAIEQEVWRRYMQGTWPVERVIVTRVINAERLTVLISESKAAKVELQTSVGGLPAELNLADASLGFSATRSDAMLSSIVAEGPLTPLFEALCIDRHGLLRQRAVRLATREGGRLEPAEFDDDSTPDAEGGVTPYQYVFGDLGAQDNDL